jgi:integrase
MNAVPRPRPPHLHRQSLTPRQDGMVRPPCQGTARPHPQRFRNVGVRRGVSGRHVWFTGTPNAQGQAHVGRQLGLAGFDRYRETNAWTGLSLATRRQRENILKHVLESSGRQPIDKVTKAALVAGRDRRAKETPFQARHFLDTLRGLFRWAVEAGLVKVDPTAGVSDPSMPISNGFPIWTEDDAAAYEKRWPIGTRQRVWLLYTGLRRGDAVRLGRQHVRDGIATLKTEKTDTEVTLPILSVLAKTLAAGPCSDLAFITNANGQPFTKESFGNAFTEACRKAGITKSAHGLRKLAATRAANAGATESQLKAIFGWTNSRMPSLYTQAADRRRLAKEAMHKLVANS